MAIYSSEPSIVLCLHAWPVWGAVWPALVNEVQGLLFGGDILRKLSLSLLVPLSALLLLFVMNDVKMAGATASILQL